MKKSVELRQQRWAKVEEAQVITNRAETSGRALTEPEMARVDFLLLEAAGIMQQVRKAEADDEYQRSLADRSPQFDS